MTFLRICAMAACVASLAATMGCGGSSGPTAALPGGNSTDLRGSAASGTITEYAISQPHEPRVRAFPIWINNGPDGALWFTERGWGILGRITTDGTITYPQYRLKVHGDGPSWRPQNVVTGPDGNLWATAGTLRTYRQESSGDPDPYGSIRSMTPSGEVKVVTPLPTMFSDARGITVGPDNRIWFAERRGAIGKMNRDGTHLHEFPLENGNAVYSIVVGSDQNLWFGETFNAIIGRITTKGKIRYFTLPKKAGPAGIVTGPDGNLYGSEFLGGKVARITTSGHVTAEWPLSKESSPKDITVGSDGNLYVAEFGIGKIARVILGRKNAGKVTEFPIPTPHSGPWGITSGPDGNIWFTESLRDKIGKLQI